MNGKFCRFGKFGYINGNYTRFVNRDIRFIIFKSVLTCLVTLSPQFSETSGLFLAFIPILVFLISGSEIVQFITEVNEDPDLIDWHSSLLANFYSNLLDTLNFRQLIWLYDFLYASFISY